MDRQRIDPHTAPQMHFVAVAVRMMTLNIYEYFVAFLDVRPHPLQASVTLKQLTPLAANTKHQYASNTIYPQSIHIITQRNMCPMLFTFGVEQGVFSPF